MSAKKRKVDDFSSPGVASARQNRSIQSASFLLGVGSDIAPNSAATLTTSPIATYELQSIENEPASKHQKRSARKPWTKKVSFGLLSYIQPPLEGCQAHSYYCSFFTQL
jgi:hypothetical protein